MGQFGWPRGVAPPSMVLATVVMLAALVPAAIASSPPAGKSGPKPVCATPDAAEIARAATRGRTPGSEFANELVLGSSGAVTGRRVQMAGPGGRVERTLPAESFVVPPAGDVFLYGFDEPQPGSVVRAFIGQTGCDVLLARPADVVRSAVLNPRGTALYVHSVGRADRRDLGISKIDLAIGTVTTVLGPPSPDESFGPTFATELAWSVDGSALAVQSCGADRCRTRTLDVATEEVEAYAGEGHGDLVALTSESLYVFDACHWAPCALLELDRDTGAATVIAEDAYSADLTTDGDRTIIRVETTAETQEVVP